MALMNRANLARTSAQDEEEYYRLLDEAREAERRRVAGEKGVARRSVSMGMPMGMGGTDYFRTLNREGDMARLGDRMQGGTGRLRTFEYGGQRRPAPSPMEPLPTAPAEPAPDDYQIKRAEALEALKRSKLTTEAMDPDLDWARQQRTQVGAVRDKRLAEGEARRDLGMKPSLSNPSPVAVAEQGAARAGAFGRRETSRDVEAAGRSALTPTALAGQEVAAQPRERLAIFEALGRLGMTTQSDLQGNRLEQGSPELVQMFLDRLRGKKTPEAAPPAEPNAPAAFKPVASHAPTAPTRQIALSRLRQLNPGMSDEELLAQARQDGWTVTR